MFNTNGMQDVLQTLRTDKSDEILINEYLLLDLTGDGDGDGDKLRLLERDFLQQQGNI